MRRGLLWIAFLGAAAALGGALGRWAYVAPGPLAAGIYLVVPRASTGDVANLLRRRGVIRSGPAFELAAEITRRDGPIRAAEFAFPAHASLRQVLGVLRFGRPVQHLVTIPEGLTSAQVAIVLARADALDGDVPVPQEGWVLPDTYAYERGTTRATVMQRAHAALDRVLAQGWRDRSPEPALTSPSQALVLASIVERETHLPQERPLVARIFLNRLAAGMRLQADPTAAYGAGGGLGLLDRELTRADLEHVDDYNTYVVDGLPEGPICNPGVAALTAALRPAAGQMLYFVADGSGGHLFARTLPEHIINVKRLREQRR